MKTRHASKMMVVVLFAFLIAAMHASGQDKPKTEAGDDVKALAAKPTPKTADGHPDLNGYWAEKKQVGFGGRVQGQVHDLHYGTPLPGANPETDAVTTDYGVGYENRKKAKLTNVNVPSYKPEFKEKAALMAKEQNYYDPTKYSCLPAGVPRLGAPRMILQTPGLVVLLHEGGYGTASYGGGNGYSTYRVVPTDGRAHRQGDDYDPNPMGDPVGHWEGNTLVIETTGFDDSTWFGGDGYFHSDAMKVTERFTRKGDTLEYSATVEDPKLLSKPFNLNPTPLTLRKGGSGEILYNVDLPCNISNPAHNFRLHADHENP
jgi:hypothetical protein